jgi:hypothetical protein
MFSPLVERWRPFVKKYTPNIPEDFVLAWIDEESGGGTPGGWYTDYDERGVLQIHPKTRINMKMSDEDWNYINLFTDSPSFDFDKHYAISSKALNYTVRSATSALRGVNFTGADFWTTVKVMHGLPTIIWIGLGDFKIANKRVPTSWNEFASWLRTAQWTIKPYKPERIGEILDNAEYAGKYAGLRASSTASTKSYSWLWLPITAGISYLGLHLLGRRGSKGRF